jgi:hypothetical protein
MRLLVLGVVSALLLGFVSVPSATVRAAEPPFHELWRDGPDSTFEGWSLRGAQITDGRLTLGANNGSTVAGFTSAGFPSTLGDLSGLVLPDDGSSGLAVAPARETSAPFEQAIASWNAATPTGTWIEVRLRARIGSRWTDWYNLGAWSSDAGPTRRQSVKGQQDEDGRVLTDTVVLKAPANAHQLAIVLRTDDPARTPAVSLAAVLASTPSTTARAVPSSRSAWGATIDVPERSQMVYPDGGPVWCSPTSISMVMAYWSDRLREPALDQTVPAVAAAVYDPIYRGNGNWPFNTAYAAQHGLLGYVSRMSSLGQVERWIEAGLPVVASIAWDPGELRNASVPSTDGHLLVIVGFTAEGNVVVNDPAADPRLGQSVRRVYDRGQFEGLWLKASGGTVYLIYPAATTPPSSEVAYGAW